MRKIPVLMTAIVAMAVVALFFATPILACDISLTPSSTTGHVGEEQSILVQVELTHRNCITPIDDTIIKASGASITSQTPWKLVETQTYQKTITILPNGEGEATIDVIRECPKGGDTANAIITVLPASGTAATSGSPTPSTVQTEPSPTAESLSIVSNETPSATVTTTTFDIETEPSAASEVTDQAQSPVQSTSKQVTLASVMTDTRLLAFLGLTIMAVFGYFTGKHRLRAIILLVSLGYLGFVTGGCLCPLGAFQKLFVGLDNFSSQRLIGYVILAIPLISTLFFGRLFCGWVCPSGALQELVHRRALAINVPPAIDWWLRKLKYVVLATLVTVVIITAQPVFEGMDPFKAAFNLSGDVVSIIALALIILTSLFIYRPWCRYLCPMGALLGLISRISLFRWVTESGCVSCKACVKNCPVQALEVEPAPVSTIAVDDHECIRCGECSRSCRKSVVSLAFRYSFPPKLVRALTVPITLIVRVASFWNA